MSTIDDYVMVAFCKLSLKADEVTQSYQSRFELEAALKNLVVKALRPYEAAVVYDASAIAGTLFTEMLEDQVIEHAHDPIAGDYYRLNFKNLIPWRELVLQDSPVAQRASLIGSRFLRDAFTSYFEGRFETFSSNSADVSGLPLAIPASDRIVTLGHNEQSSLEEASTQLIAAVSIENAIDGDPSLRQRVIGQLKAGRELIRAQTLNAYLLYSSVMTVLGGLIERYRGQAIGVAAAKLLELLIEHIFGK